MWRHLVAGMTQPLFSAHWDSYRFLFRVNLAVMTAGVITVIANSQKQLSSRELRAPMQPAISDPLQTAQGDLNTPSSTILSGLSSDPSLTSPGYVITRYMNCHNFYMLNDTSKYLSTCPTDLCCTTATTCQVLPRTCKYSRLSVNRLPWKLADAG